MSHLRNAGILAKLYRLGCGIKTAADGSKKLVPPTGRHIKKAAILRVLRKQPVKFLALALQAG